MVLTHAIKAKASDVYGYLADMQKFAKIHPVIYKAEMLEPMSFKVYEKIRLLGIAYSFSYKVFIEKAIENQYIKMYSPVQTGVKLWLTFSLEENKEGHCIVKEEVRIKAPIGIKQLFARILKKMHLRFFEALRKELA